MTRKQYTSDLDPFLERVSISNKHVLDVGCGNGDKARQLVSLGAQVTGIEPDLNSWQVSEIETDGFNLMRGGAESIELEDDSVDIAMLMYSCHHIPVASMALALKEVQRVVKANGLIYIAEPIATGSYQQACESFLDETVIRNQAINAIEDHLMSQFKHCDQFEYTVPEYFSDFSDFCDKMMAYSLNRYTIEQVNTPAVKKIFEQFNTESSYQLDQPVRCWVIYNHEHNLLEPQS